MPDGSGIAPGDEPATFLASSGRGGVLLIDAVSGSSLPIAAAFLGRGHWDNHMIVAPG